MFLSRQAKASGSGSNAMTCAPAAGAPERELADARADIDDDVALARRIAGRADIFRRRPPRAAALMPSLKTVGAADVRDVDLAHAVIDPAPARISRAQRNRPAAACCRALPGQRQAVVFEEQSGPAAAPMWNLFAAPDYAIPAGLSGGPYNPARLMVKRLIRHRTADRGDVDDPCAEMRSTASASGSISNRHRVGAWREAGSSASRMMPTWPGQKTRSPRLSAGRPPLERQRLADRLRLHVAVARCGDAAGRERHLHEARAVEAEARLAAPEIGHAEKPLGDRDPVRLERVERREVLHHDGAARRDQRVAGVPVLRLAGDGHPRAKRQRVRAAAI